jgi:hypothetical protein
MRLNGIKGLVLQLGVGYGVMTLFEMVAFALLLLISFGGMVPPLGSPLRLCGEAMGCALMVDGISGLLGGWIVIRLGGRFGALLGLGFVSICIDVIMAQWVNWDEPLWYSAVRELIVFGTILLGGGTTAIVLAYRKQG